MTAPLSMLFLFAVLKSCPQQESVCSSVQWYRSSVQTRSVNCSWSKRKLRRVPPGATPSTNLLPQRKIVWFLVDRENGCCKVDNHFVIIPKAFYSYSNHCPQSHGNRAFEPWLITSLCHRQTITAGPRNHRELRITDDS